MFNPKVVKAIPRDGIKLDDWEFKKELAKKMNNTNYFTDRILNTVIFTTLDSHHLNYTSHKVTITPKKSRNDKVYVKKRKELTKSYAR